MRLEGLGQLKESNDPIWNQILHLPACSLVPPRNYEQQLVKADFCMQTLSFLSQPALKGTH
jgi:hypothetical protein